MGKTKKNMVLVLSRATRADEKWRAKFQGEIKSQHSFDVYILSWSLRGPATQHLHNEARRAEFDGGGWTEYQKCPLIFFILCRYIDKVYTYIYM